MKSQINKLISIFACVCLLVSALIVPTFAADSTASYVKVTEAPADWSGDYLIVYEGGKKAYNGALTDLKKANGIDVTIADSKIEATDAMKAAQFTIAAVDGGYSIKSSSGYYIGRTSANTDSNDLLFSTSTVYVNAISMSGSDVNIVSGNTYLRWNNSSSFFRYYKSGTYTNQAAIALYKLEVASEEEPACEHTTTATEPNGDETHKVVCDACGETITAVVDCTDDDSNGKCDICDGDVTVADDGGDEGGETPTATEIALTVDSLGLASGSYSADTTTVDGVGFEWVQLGNYGDGIQVRDKNGNTSTFWNTTAFDAPIKEIKLVYSSTQNVTYSNANAEIFSFGNAVDTYTYSTKLSTTAGVKEYTITPDAETYTFLKFEHDLGYSMYWDSITIVLAGDDTTGGEGGEVTPPAGGNEPTCEHTTTSTEPNGNETHKVVCDACGETITAVVDCTDADKNGKCDVCDGDVEIPVQDPAADSTLSIVDAAALGASKEHNTYTAGKYYIEGKIAAFQSNDNATKYGNFYLEDDAGNQILIYGLYSEDGEVRYDAMETKPVAGDTVKVYGILGQYNGTAQMKNGWLIEHTPATTPDDGGDEGDDTPDTPVVTDPAADSQLSIVDAAALGASKEHNTYTAGKYYIEGKIAAFQSNANATKYGNFYLEDDAGNQILIYGLYSEDGEVRYDAMETKPVAGDTVKVYGILGQYNGTAQMKNGWLIEHTPATTPDDGGDEGDDTPDTPVELPTPDDTNTLTITEALELGAAQATGEYAADKYYVTGQIVSITNDMYGNMYIADEDGNEILVYGTYSADGELRYDAMETKPDVGDTVTLYSVVGNHNDTPQLKNAWIIEFTEGELDVETPAEPEADSVLSITEALELGLTKRHNEYTDAKYYITGKVVEYSTNYETYGNMYIEDAEGNRILVYGMYSEDGEIRYDEFEDKPEIGDTITVYGVIGQYNGTPQMKNGWLKAAPATDDGENDTTGGTTDDNTTGGTTGDTTTGAGSTTDINKDNATTSPDTSDAVGSCVAMAIAAAAVVLYTSKKR